MPCYDVDGDAVACLIDGKFNPEVAFGSGVDYEQAKKLALATPKASTYNPANDPSQLLGEYGFEWQGGNGQYARWKTPDGLRVMSEESAVKLVQAAETAKPGGGGLTYEQQLTLKNTPSRSVSYSAPNDLDYAQDARAAENDRLNRERQDRLDAQDITRYNGEIAREDAKARVLERQWEVSNERGNRQEAREIQRDLQDVQNRIDDRRSRIDEINTAAQNRAAEFNANAEMDAADRTERARVTNLADKRQNAVDIANYQQMPGDIAKIGAYLQARQGEGGSDISTAIGQGENFITDESLKPLQELLNVQASQTHAPVFSGARMTPALLAQQQQQPPPGIFAGARQAPPNAPTTLEAGAITLNTATGKYEQNGREINPFDASGNLSLAGAIPQPQRTTETQGMTQDDSPAAPPPPGIFESARQASYTPGGVNTGPKVTPANARVFQREAAAKSRTRSGLLGDLTPIRYADPGSDPYLAELAAGVTAAERGVDTRVFQRERQRITPRGMQQRVFARGR